MNPEQERLDNKAELRTWRRWGPYLAERQWGTVREDYSRNGDAWAYFPFPSAHLRAYRWGEDGIGGFSDDQQLLCLSVALWNERDPILKERMFGVSGPEGNHAEDVKECYYYLDGLPTHAYMRMLYKYPHLAFPYDQLREENGRRSREEPEYELWDTGVFDAGYFDVDIEYAKADPDDIVLHIRVTNRGSASARVHVLPQVWFRNTWTWNASARPLIEQLSRDRLMAKYVDGRTRYVECSLDTPLFTENESNPACFGPPAQSGYFKDAFHRWLIHRDPGAVNPQARGTKAAFHGAFALEAGGAEEIKLRLSADVHPHGIPGTHRVVADRRADCDRFYADLQASVSSEDLRLIQRQAYAGMLWTKQVYCLDVATWLDGDPAQPPPPPERRLVRNRGWKHLSNLDVVSMPDTWEYPWYAAWDLAFQCVPLAEIDPDFAKQQLLLFVREWYQHPNGQIPAYEWNFSDVNPPVHAWGALEVYDIDRRRTGIPDKQFLSRIFQKLLLNFTWWVNRKDADGNNMFEGGFLGLDNIGLFNRSEDIPGGGRLEQADGTGWMAMYCLNMLRMALELAEPGNAYEDMASKFFEHFLRIAGAMHNMGDQGLSLWDDEEDFYHDVLHIPGQPPQRLRVRSMVGLIPLFAVEVFSDERLQSLPGFEERMRRLRAERPRLARLVSRWEDKGSDDRHLVSIARAYRMTKVLQRLLDSREFLGDHGIRALSKHYQAHPYRMPLGQHHLEIRYTPGESDTAMFGGNSNWRGPIWFPVNFLLITSLRKYHEYYGDSFVVECPVGSGTYLTLEQVAHELTRRLVGLFALDAQGRRAIWGHAPLFERPDFRDHLLFYEYFNGDTGQGHGASHQTGWTGLVATLIGQGRA
jgi:hypothetical protein